MSIRSTTITYSLDSPEIKSLCAADERLSILITHYGDLTYSLHEDTFEFLVETIVRQMLSSKVADVITARLYDLCDNSLDAEAVLRLDVAALRAVGLSGPKADYILKLASLFIDSPDYFEVLPSEPDDVIIKRLTSLRGIGAWSAKMYLIFVLDRLNVMPYEDGAFQQSYKWLYQAEDMKPATIQKRCASWTPYSSLAARYLYRALDDGLMRDDELGKKLRS